VGILALHDFCELDLEVLNGTDRRETVVAAQAVDVELSFGDVCNVVVLEIEDPLGVLNHGRGVRSDKEFDGLGHAVLGQEGTGLGAAKLRSGSRCTVTLSRGDVEQTTGVNVVRN
jgi:hypothetical protein